MEDRMLSDIARLFHVMGVDWTWKSVAAIGIGMPLLGFISLAFLLMLMRQSAGDARARRRLATMAAASAMILAASAAFGLGIIYPLVRASLNTRQLDYIATRINNLARIESERLVRDILSHPRYQDPKKLNWYEFRMSSQNGEDGIIAEIFRRIGTTSRSFVEFGSSSGDENNTVFLLRQGGAGLWMDGDSAAIAKARTAFRTEISEGKLKVIEAFITAENIEDLRRQGQVPEEPDLLSIDIDRNDYHVWEKITQYKPRCVVVEYNSMLPPNVSWVVPYDPKAWGWTSFGNGASLKALEQLGEKKGYSLVGYDLCGVNAFFVRSDLLGDHFAKPYTAENHFEPYRYNMIIEHHYQRSSLNPQPEGKR
jgi:hypothetical protein